MKLLRPTARDLVLDCGGGDSSYFPNAHLFKHRVTPWPETLIAYHTLPEGLPSAPFHGTLGHRCNPAVI
jgi:hypothetical protein